MKSFAIVAFAGAAVAFPQYEAAPVNSTSVAYSTPAVPSYVASASSSSAPSYQATTVQCSGPTEIPVGPSYHPHLQVCASAPSVELLIDSHSYPVSAPVGEYTPVPVVPSVPSVPSYPTSNGTTPAPPAGTAPPAATGTGSYTVPSPSAPVNFPGAGAKTGLSMLAVAGALAAFL